MSTATKTTRRDLYTAPGLALAKRGPKLEHGDDKPELRAAIARYHATRNEYSRIEAVAEAKRRGEDVVEIPDEHLHQTVAEHHDACDTLLGQLRDNLPGCVVWCVDGLLLMDAQAISNGEFEGFRLVAVPIEQLAIV